MATNTKPTESQSDLREELETLRKQVSELMQALKDKGEDKAERLGKKLESELGQYQDKAERKLHDVYDAGEAGVDELSERVRKNPVTSLLVAFSAGYIISKVLDNDK